MPLRISTETGFPQSLIDELKKRIGRHIIGNKSASGTEILDELAKQEIQNRDLIVYTSADSVLQICGNEEMTGVEILYHYCEIARELTMRPEWMMGRVIARPYIRSKKGESKRTSNRYNYILKSYGEIALDALKEAGLDIISIGKIKGIFDDEGITQAYKSKSSVRGMEQMIEVIEQDFHGLCFVNLVDSDALWGHCRNPVGYGEELRHFDELLGVVFDKLQGDNLLITITDHGDNPIHKGTDHTKEMVPSLTYSPCMEGRGLLPVSDTLAMTGIMIASNLEVSMLKNTIGTSYLKQLK